MQTVRLLIDYGGDKFSTLHSARSKLISVDIPNMTFDNEFEWQPEVGELVTKMSAEFFDIAPTKNLSFVLKTNKKPYRFGLFKFPIGQSVVS